MVLQTGRLDEPVSFPKDKTEWHHFLDGYVEVALAIRGYVESLPETAATFDLKPIQEEYQRNIDNRLVKLTGAWQTPTTILGDANKNKWVNPKYVHAQHYSDAMVQCECGIPVLRMNFGEQEQQPTHHQEHKDDCTKINRLESRAQLLRNRREIIKEAYDLGHSATSISQRLGYHCDNQLGGYELSQLGINPQELATEGRKKLARTAMVLCRDYNTKTVGKLFGIHRKSIGEIVTKETKTTSKKLYAIRRQA